MTKEQAATNAPTLTKELVDKITSFNIKNCLDEIDNQKDLSESEIEEICNRYEKNFIREVKESFSKVKKITDIELAFRLILETDIEIYNDAIENHLSQICSQEDIQNLEKKSTEEQYKNRPEIQRIESLRPNREQKTLIDQILSKKTKSEITR
ncbi:MAG: hypothetical protein ISP24_02685 [Rickettsiales bacterium]|nr:hypothetical protein [Rickettsiales bacterium]